MRPNSLFFDRDGGRGFSRVVSLFITAAFLVFVGYILIRYKQFTCVLREEFLTTPVFGWLLLGYALLLMVFVVIIRQTNSLPRRSPALWAVAIFLIALAPRVLLALHAANAETNGPAAGLLSELSAQLLWPCVVASVNAALVYLVARRLDEASAPAAGLLFALYPANIAVSSTSKDVSVEVLLALLSILLLLLALSSQRRLRAALLAALSGAALAFGCVTLDSLRVLPVAYGAVGLAMLLSCLHSKKELLRLVLVALAFCIVFFGLRAAGLETSGRDKLDALRGTTASFCAGEPDANAFTLDQLAGSFIMTDEPTQLDGSVAYLWQEKDACFNSASGDSALLRGMQLMDFFFVAGVFLFAWVGVLLRRRGGAWDLLLWVFLVWAAVHLLSEQQAITRSVGMPLLMMFAANGFFMIVGPCRRQKNTPAGASVCPATLFDGENDKPNRPEGES